MRGKTLTLRFVALLIFLLIIYPTLFALFVQSGGYSDGLRTVFLLFKQPLLAILAMTLFFLFAKSSLHTNPLEVILLSRWREFLIFFIAGILCLVLSTTTQTDLNQILNSGISIHNKKVHWDTHRWGVLPFLSESDPVGEQYLWVHTPEQRLMKTVLATVSRTTNDERRMTVLKWYGIWQDGNSNGVLDDQVWLEVEGQHYEVTEQYRHLQAGKPEILEMALPESFGLQVSGFELLTTDDSRPTTVLTLQKSGTSDSVGWVAQATYLLRQTAEWKPDLQQWQTTQFQEAMVWVAEPNPWYFSLLFKLGFLLRWLGMILLFFAFFGRQWILSFVKRSPLQTILSLAYAPVILLLGVGIRQSWPWLAQGVGWSLYGLLKLIPVGGTPFIRIPDGIHVEVGIERFWVNIADTCSGMESIGLFAGMYLGLILFNYRCLHLGKALALIVPGLVGTYVVNLVRIYGLFLAGLVWGNEVMNAFHTYLGMVLFVVFFLWFWRISQRWICFSSPERRAPSDEPRATSHRLKTAPAVVSGLLVFALVAGHEVFSPIKEGRTACSDYTTTFVFRATDNKCSDQRQIGSISYSDPCGFGCSEREISGNDYSLPTCAENGTTKDLTYQCWAEGFGPCSFPSTRTHTYTWSGTTSGCPDPLYAWESSGSVDNLNCLIARCSNPSSPPAPSCGSTGAGSSYITYVDATCVPEFPAFFPLLFSLLAPLLRWRWGRG